MSLGKIGISLATAAVLAVYASTLAAQAPAQVDKVAIIVNGEKIQESEVRAILGTRPANVVLTAAQKKEMQDSAVNMLVDDALMRQFLKKYAAAATPQEIQKEVNDLAADLKKKNTTVEEYLKTSGQTLEQLKLDIAGAIQWRNYLTSRIPEDVAKAYYDANKLHFDKVLVRASHILVQVKPDAPAAEKQAAFQKIETIRQEVVSGKIDFAAAARKYSDCTASKDSGGDIGHFRYKFVVVEPIAKATFAAKAGEVTGPIATDFGYHIFKITDRTAGEPSNFANIKDVVREVYAQDNEWYQRIIANERKTAKIEVFLP
jgi:parvulin-like peptidyl-prolyl isomerase